MQLSFPAKGRTYFPNWNGAFTTRRFHGEKCGFKSMAMICSIHVVAHFILMIVNLAGALDVPPPRDVKIKLYELQWASPSGDDNVLYTVQYKRGSEPADDWHTVPSHNGTKCAITKEFYGAKFRVRAEKDGRASEWQMSNPVQCVHLNICIPLMTVNVKPGKTYLSLSHMDESFEKEYKAHIEFNISSWKVVTGGYSEVQFNVTNNNNEVFLNLESGQTYCFQVQYSFYKMPYGNTSKQQCVIIPETSEEAKRRTILTTILTTLCILTLCGCCSFLLFKNHKKYKQLLRPPVDIPGHLREFLSQQFSQQPSPSPSVQSVWSCDVITLIDNISIGENGQEGIS